MSKLIFKLRGSNPNKHRQAYRNADHVRYIATRAGVAMNEGMKHGLFGKYGDMQSMENIENHNDMANYVKEKSLQKTNMYRAIISFREEDAVMVGLTEREAWEKLINSKIDYIANEIGIKAQNLEWCAAVHMEKGHPHLHAVFWDKDQKVKDYFIPQEISNGIRKKLLKDVFAEQLSELYFEKEELKKEIGGHSNGFFDDFTDFFDGMSDHDFMRIKKKIIADDKNLADMHLMFNKFSEKFTLEIAEDLIKLSGSVPKHGRMSYDYMPREVKKEVDTLVSKMINGNKDLKRTAQKYFNNAAELTSFYTSNPDAQSEAAQKAYDDMMKRLGNKVLRTIKEMNGREKELQQEAYRRDMVLQLISEMFFVLSQHEEQTDAQLHNLKNGELSKQAKIELAKQMESKGLDWD